MFMRISLDYRKSEEEGEEWKIEVYVFTSRLIEKKSVKSFDSYKNY